MSDPVAVVVELSAVDAAPVVENHNESPVSDSVSQLDTPADPVPDADPVSQAVAASIGQYVGFDPAIHAVNPDGTPRMRAHGKGYALKRGKGGRKSVPVETTDGADDLFANANTETAQVSETIATPTPQTSAAPAGNTPLNSREAAAMIVLTCTTVLSRVVGAEWQADKDETRNLTHATKVYLDSKGGLNVTPEMALFLAVTGYAVPRLAHENTQSKFQRALQWCRDRFDVARARMGRAK